MAKGPIMLQIAVEQIISAFVQDAPEIWTVAFAALDGDRTTVREIASEKSHALAGVSDPGYEWGMLEFSQFALTDLWLAFPDLRRPPTVMQAPSHVPSPPINGARLALLRVRDYGFSIDPHGGFSIGRRVGAHAYLDEVKAV